MVSASKFNWAFCFLLAGVIWVSSLNVAADELTQLPAYKLVQVDDSSIWLLDSDYDKFSAGVELPNTVFMQGKITKADIKVFQTLLAPYLDPKYLQTHQKPLWFKPDPSESTFNVSLDSQGGEVMAALELGRLFRKARVTAIVGKGRKCLSSCIFLLAGAVRRNFIEDHVVGIHRPYSSSTNASSYESMQESTLKLGEQVRTYLMQMNIPDSLYEDMRRVPPEQIKMLSPNELEKYGLNANDPVFAELNDNVEANLAGVSKTEFLLRKALSKQCLEEGYLRLSRANNNGKIDTLALAKLRNECDQKTIYKDVLDESGNWRGTPAYQYCWKLSDAVTTAIGDRDWRKVLEVAKEREQNCAEKMTVNDLAVSIYDQAEASLQLGNPQEAVSAANRCLRISKNPDCHITKGLALVELSQRRKGVEEIKLGKRLADQEVSRLRIELQRVSSESETDLLKSELEHYQSMAQFAKAILMQKSPRSSP
jgi:tetratricopeptide (TPR) repeat protein